MNLFNQIKAVNDRPHGWCSLEKSITLASIIIAVRPKNVLEIGVWSGKSLLPMALACKHVGYGHVTGVDPFSPEASAEGQNQLNADWWRNHAHHEAMLNLFNEQVVNFEVTPFVTHHRIKSDDYEPDRIFQLIHIDGNHGPQALKDTEKFSKFSPVGGYIVLDDIHWDGGAVGAACQHLEGSGFERLYTVTKPGDSTKPADDWAVFQKR